jgi:hypothetical protein
MQAKDILDYEKELVNAGVTNEQARVHAHKLAELLDNNTVTKDDLEKFSDKIFAKFEVVDVRINAIDSKLNWLIVLISLSATLIPLSNYLMHYFKIA